VPGDPYSALSAVANSLSGTDLVIVSADQDLQALAKAWFYLPRALSPSAAVYLEQPTADGRLSLRRVPAEELARLAAPPARRRAA
jgi:hypothetical protein